MNRTRFYTALRSDTKERVKGYLWLGSSSCYIIPYTAGIGYDELSYSLQAYAVPVMKETIGECTNVQDANFDTLYETDIVESNFSGDKHLYEVVFDKGSFGLKWIHNDVERFAPFTSFTDTLHMVKVGNKFDTVSPEFVENYSMCGSVSMAIDIVNFIKRSYEKGCETQAGCQKYVDALKMAEEALGKIEKKKAFATGSDDQDEYTCPTCGAFLCGMDWDDQPSHCNACGQHVIY